MSFTTLADINIDEQRDSVITCGYQETTTVVLGLECDVVADFDDLDWLDAGGGAQVDDVAFVRLQQRAGDRGNPADAAVIRIDLVDTNDRDRSLGSVADGIGHRGAEKDLVAPCLTGRIDDLRTLQPLREKADPPVDLAQFLLAVEIIAVFRAIAV